MAITAQDREMASRELEASLFVLRQGEAGWLESLDGVALLALVAPGRGGELGLVFVVVTVETASKLDLVEGFFAFGNVTLRAFELGVLAFKWILG
jgi:hypothetical protein